ncbi:hypothetical protein Pan44_21550 [Caulifigura coniformis]|uniref:SLA1 homology domain-containing protein n=1 Tax=Caulifigura coniformis TaxID=2527983 RepID=A0A517SDD3_9PLAN|nr:hypothetical protein [Caulifigura coniformis]QDT54128.1 hypothetical protein Pan44_21550 [Caulifigura coniformis]
MALASRQMWLFLALVGGLAGDRMALAQETPPFRPIPAAQPAEIDLTTKFGVSQLVELKSDRKGQIRYGMFINVPKRQKAFVTLQETPARRGYARGGFPISKAAGGEAKVELTFEYTLDERQDEPNPLLSTVDTIGYAWKSAGCDHPAGGVSAFSLPLNTVATADKKIVLLDPNDPLARIEQGYRLMLIIPKDANPITPDEVEAIQPRGEVIVQTLTPTEPPEPAIDDQLVRAWERRNRAIGTGHFKYQDSFVAYDQVKPLTINEIDQILGEKPWQLSRKEGFARLLKVFTQETADQFKGLPPAWSELLCVGLRSIERASYGDIRLIEADIDLHFDAANRQLKVVQQDAEPFLAATSLYDFLGDPFGPEFLKGASTRMVDGLAIVERKEGTIVVDPRTGFVFSSRINLENGEPYRYRLQLDPQAFSGGLSLPRLAVSMDFEDGKLSSVQVFSVEEMRINEPFTQDDFKLRIEPGTTIVDERNAGPDGPPSYRLKQPIEDAAAHFRKHRPLPVPRSLQLLR